MKPDWTEYNQFQFALLQSGFFFKENQKVSHEKNCIVSSYVFFLLNLNQNGAQL